MSSEMHAYLLDKNIVRHSLAGMVKLQTGHDLSSAEAGVLTFLWQADQSKHLLFISLETDNLLQRYAGHAEIAFLRDRIDIFLAGRYFKRWARRLLDHSFTREDAKILSLGSFGTNQAGDILGVDVVITLDQRFVNNFNVQYGAIRQRFRAMTTQLVPPYSQAVLPRLLTPVEILEQSSNG